jgi:hypothetical protein
VWADDENIIHFDSKPSCVHRHAPIIIDVQSRKKPITETTETTNEDDDNVNNNNNNNNATTTTTTIENKKITLEESNLFQQSLDRILVQSQFRAYLSKLLLFASTGYATWCFYYEQEFTKQKFFSTYSYNAN